jgi:hypothetical protein
LDLAESGLQDLALDLGQNGAISHDLIVDNVCGQALLANVFKRYGPQSFCMLLPENTCH